MKKRSLRAERSGSLSGVKGLVNLDPFCEALEECTRRGASEEFDGVRFRMLFDCMHERISWGLKLVENIGDLSEDTVAVTIAATLSGSPFRLTGLLPLLTFSRERALQALVELEELKVVVTLEDQYRTFVFLHPESRSPDDSQAGAASDPSPREQEVAKLISQGLTNYQIGVRLGVSQRTVETYIQRLFRKLNVSSRSQIVAWHICQETALRSAEG